MVRLQNSIYIQNIYSLYDQLITLLCIRRYYLHNYHNTYILFMCKTQH